MSDETEVTASTTDEATRRDLRGEAHLSVERAARIARQTPDTVTGGLSRQIYVDCNIIRTDIKRIAADLDVVRVAAVGTKNGEAIANATLAYRHLEDASMRLGKVLQALDGGVSVYDKATTVGAPEKQEG